MIARSETLEISGAKLFYRVRGTGPLLLILAGGHGDADSTEALCDNLIQRFTVVTYDRRGLSRSTTDVSTGSLTIGIHSDDVHRLLAALTATPVFVFGSSIGALIGLDLVARHPEQVRNLVAHEAPAWDLLSKAARGRAIRALDDVAKTFHEEGATAAFHKFAALSAIDYSDHEADVVLREPTPQVEENLKFLFSKDLPAVNSYRIDTKALIRSPSQITPAAGKSSGDSAPRQCATALAEKLGTGFVEFPGGHTGWLLRPKEFSAKLLEVL